MRTLAHCYILMLALGACRAPKAGPAADAGSADDLPVLSINASRTDLLFTFVDDEGRLRDVDAVAKVPEARRKQVLVRDLSKSPEEVRADRYVLVADLTRESDAGFPYAVMSRYQIDRAIRTGDLGADDGENPGQGGVTLYGTSWCGACAQARAWLRAHGIAFADKDVEKDPRAQSALARKLRAAGIDFGGVPVLDVHGQLLVGFDPSAIEGALRRAPSNGPQPSP